MSDLVRSVKDLYITKISDSEASLAGENLLGFFKLLEKIQIRRNKELNSKNNNNNSVCENDKVKE